VLTYNDQFGEESGASREAQVKVAEGQGLSVQLPTQWDDHADSMSIYISRPDGEILYALPATYTYPGETVLVTPNLLGRGKELETHDRQPPKAGKLLAHMNGRIYIARKDVVWFTEALRYALVRPSQGLYMFPGEVTLLAPTSDGIYVGFSDPGGVVFLQGSDPYDVTQLHVLPGQPVPRACTFVPGHHFDQPVDQVPVWWMQSGAMVAGLPGGRIEQLSTERLDVGKFNAGALLYRNREGMNQVISSLQRGEGPMSVGASDSAVASVRRNTIKLNQ
jgi:hypothetical protein